MLHVDLIFPKFHMRFLIHFARFGPYHHARLRAAQDVLSQLGWEVIGLETAGNDATYAWDETKGAADGPKVITVFPGRVYEEITAAEYQQTLLPLLDSLKPAAMAIAGWGSTDARLCLDWCRKHDARRIVMSETRAADGRRVWWKELVKRQLVSRFQAGLVGAKSHRDYLATLGIKPERIALGYNVVDNAFFERKTEDFKTEDRRRKIRSQEDDDKAPDISLSTSHCSLITAHSPFFLASNRFIERKNLVRLLEAYAEYVKSFQFSVFSFQSEEANGQAAESSSQAPSSSPSPTPPLTPSPPHPLSPSPWHLCLLGDGELKGVLLTKCAALGLQVNECAPWESSTSTIDNHQSSIINLSAVALAKEDQNKDISLHDTPLSQSRPARRSSPTVWMPGFRQIDELPRFYAHAGCFVHPAMEEPWGLVINEAMASGLPVLSSSNVGAAEELVDDGVNGWTFDPSGVDAMTGALTRIATLPPEQLAAFGTASRRILEERCPTRAFGEGLAKLVGTDFA
jgi:glycosyltransferase involved in cell wall biosynthesis